MSRKRRAYEAGHRPKFLVVIDGSDACDRAVYYTARRVARIGAQLILVQVASTSGASQQWLGVADLMRAESRQAAMAKLERFAARARDIAGVEAELVVREGEPAAEVVRLINEDEDIALLVLGASGGKEGPGPLVAALAGAAAGTLPVPLAIVPGDLADAEIDALS